MRKTIYYALILSLLVSVFVACEGLREKRGLSDHREKKVRQVRKVTTLLWYIQYHLRLKDTILNQDFHNHLLF